MWSVIGHKNAITLLKRSLEKSMVSHAYLLVGPDRLGYSTLLYVGQKTLESGHVIAIFTPPDTAIAVKLIKFRFGNTPISAWRWSGNDSPGWAGDRITAFAVGITG